MSIAPKSPTLHERLVTGYAEWVFLDASGGFDPKQFGPALEKLRPHIPDRAAAVDLPAMEPAGRSHRFWRRDHLLMVLRSGELPLEIDAEGLAVCAERQAFIFRKDSTPKPPMRGRALLVSSFGIRRFGGAEHFLMQMSSIYAGLGYAPLIVGTRPEFEGESGQMEGVDYTYISSRPEALFRLAIEEKAALAHVVSGLGHEVAAALRFLDMRLVFGVHFWRELFFSPVMESGFYPDCPQDYARKPTFSLLLSDYDAVYANSEFTRAVVEENFGARLPVIPSIPDDLEPADADQEDPRRDYVLLVNARSDKGFDLLLDIAALLPGIRFCAIASQSEAAGSRAAAAARDLTNIEIITRVEVMAPLYRGARAVLVPSYRFVETFSRVVIEAHRHGVPVLGSDSGNVPLLLRQSGVVLAEDPTAWADELRRLWTDQPYWDFRSRAALESSRRYAFAEQPARLARLVRGLDAPVLVGVGSGAGNLLHATPLIRNLARRLGALVDVVVAGDWASSLSLVANPEHVRHVFQLSDVPVNRYYETVFLTHSFGPMVPAFHANRLAVSRDWDSFHPGHRLHEAEFNLAAAQALLGVPYDPEDVRGASVGHFRYTIPKSRLIGLHAGSKPGAWALKRWPHFATLAAHLTAEGFEVASFGTEDEHVPGTLNLTGGSMEEMTQRMLRCRAFVSNDSGVMNIANALGIPLLALFGPTSARTRGPLGRNSLALSVNKPCAPCELDGARGAFRTGECACIGEISAAEVLHAVRELVWRTAPQEGSSGQTARNVASFT